MQEQRPLRGLFIIKADKIFDDTHPLWETIQTYRPLLEETHILVFTHAVTSKQPLTTTTDGNLFIYQCTSKHLLLRAWKTWKLLSFQLYWRKTFRADFLMSFTPGRGGLFGYILANRFKKPYFMVASLRMAHSAKKVKRFIARYLLRKATMVFVPGSANALALSKLLSIPPAQLVPIQPPVDVKTISHTTDHVDYHAAHPQYNFFITSFIETVESLRVLMLIHAQIAAKYPRVALIVLVPRGQKETFEHFIQSAKGYGIFVYDFDDQFLPKLTGSHVYLDINEFDETNTTLLYALGAGIPTVAYAAGTAAELFPGTPYARFACTPGDTDEAAKLVMELVEHQATRNDYAINAELIFKKFSSQDTPTYVHAVHENVLLVLEPPKEGVSAVVMLKKEMESSKNDTNTVG